MEDSSHRILELYSGIGGMHYAWNASGIKGKIIGAIEINTVANSVYKYNFKDTNLLNRNIQSVSADFINSLNPDTILMSPPCQPFTRNGLQKDAEDPRTTSFKHLLEILKDLHNLNYILMENVKGFETSNSRDVFIETLKNCQYYYQEFLLSPQQFGIPNSRLRYYCLARRKPFNLELTDEPNLFYRLPNTRETECFMIGDIIEDGVSENVYGLPAKFMKRAFVLDICYADSNRSCCFTKAYTHFLEGTGSVYTRSSQEEVKRVFEECSNMDGKSEEYSDRIQKLQLRYFTPKEVSRLMAFPDTFSFPTDISRKQCYRLLGNSINVKVVSELIKYLIKEN